MTYWGANGITNTNTYTPSRSNKEAGQNISVGVVVNDIIVLNDVNVTNENGIIVLDINVGKNYFIKAHHDADTYYTEIEKTDMNRTYYVNVTSQTTNNSTVNITAKSNIYNEITPGKLLFILQNGDEINANYASNGTGWALHTFDGAGDYMVNASYIGLEDVIINNATINIRYDASFTLNNYALNLVVDDNFTVVAITTPEDLNVTFVPDDSGVVSVDYNGVVTALKSGTAIVVVKVGGDGVYAENSTTLNVTVSKAPAEIIIANDTLDVKVLNFTSTGASLNPANAGNLTYTSNDTSVAVVENGVIKALAVGTATITVSFAGNEIMMLQKIRLLPLLSVRMYLLYLLFLKTGMLLLFTQLKQTTKFL